MSSAPVRCSKDVYRTMGNWGRSSPCRNRGLMQFDGKWYCRVHNPAAERKRDEERLARSHAAESAFNQKWNDAELGAVLRPHLPTLRGMCDQQWTDYPEVALLYDALTPFLPPLKSST